MIQSGTHIVPSTKRGSVHFLGSCSCAYLHKQASFLLCWINIFGCQSNNRKSCPSQEERVALCSARLTCPCRSLKYFFHIANGHKRAGKCCTNCSLAVFLTNYKTKAFRHWPHVAFSGQPCQAPPTFQKLSAALVPLSLCLANFRCILVYLRISYSF